MNPVFFGILTGKKWMLKMEMVLSHAFLTILF